MNFKEKIVNGLYGLAVCDAVGNLFEFELDIDPEDVTMFANESKILTMTDDSQMTIFGFDGVKNLEFYEGSLKEKVKQSFTDSYLDWHTTQVENKVYHKEHSSGLLSFESLWSVQAPGNTCLGSLEEIKSGVQVKNNSKGCGSVMRLLPVLTLWDSHFLPKEELIELGQITGRITHLHKENDLAISRYIDTACNILNDIDKSPEYGKIKHIKQIGSGWTALECVEMAIYSYYKARTFEELLQISISHDGDSDSVGAIAGSLWGLSGKEVPTKYIEKLDSIDSIKYTVDNYK